MYKIVCISLTLLISTMGMQICSAKTITLNPNETKLLANNSLWTVNATCTVQSAHKGKGKIRISVLKNKGTVNGKNLSTGQATMLNVNSNSSISFSADSGTKINLVNMGPELLQAVCSI